MEQTIVQLVLALIFMAFILIVINLLLEIQVLWSLIIGCLIVLIYLAKTGTVMLVPFSPLISIFISVIVFSIVAVLLVELIFFFISAV